MIKEYSPVIQSPGFRYLWASQILSQLTINIMNFLLLTRLYEVTGSPIATSLLWVAYALPAIVIGPIGAATVDMVARRKILKLSNFLQAAVIFVYAFLHQTSLFLLYGVAMAYSFFNQFYVPAEAASLPSLVNKKFLPQANGLFFITQQTSLVVGFGIAGILKQFLGFETTLFLGSGLLFLAFVSVTALPRMASRDNLPTNFEGAFLKFFQRILEGYHFIRQHRRVFIPFALLMSIQICLAVVVVNVPVIARELIGVDINAAGVYIIVPAGIGAIAGAIISSRLLKSGWRKKRTIEFFFTLLTLALLLLLFLVPEIQSYRMVLGPAVILLVGLSFVGIVIPSQTFLQEVTPGGLRGRVFGNFWFLSTIATVFPVLFSGTVVELLGIRFLIFIFAGLSLAGLVFSRKFGETFLNKGLKIELVK